MTTRTVSAETRAKRSASMAAAWARRRSEPGAVEAVSAAISKAWRERLDSDPAFAARQSAKSSAHMSRLHSDSAFQERRAVRSSEVLRRVWADPVMRDRLTQMSRERYAAGQGIAGAEAEARKREANKWIMTKCSEEMRASTDYAAVYTETQARIRAEMPYDGPTDHAFYQEYLSKLGRAVTSDPKLRAIQDTFMADAIPRWAEAWRALCAGEAEQTPHTATPDAT